MAMKPFCGYNFADYWRHWLSFTKQSSKLPKIFHVNWFRQADDGSYLWPGFGDNIRVLEWIINRCEGKVEARSTPIGHLPYPEDINTKNLDITTKQLQTLININAEGWTDEIEDIGNYLSSFGPRTPKQLLEEQKYIAFDNIEIFIRDKNSFKIMISPNRLNIINPV